MPKITPGYFIPKESWMSDRMHNELKTSPTRPDWLTDDGCESILIEIEKRRLNVLKIKQQIGRIEQ